MKTIISAKPIRQLNPHFSPSILLFHYPSLPRKNRNFLHFSNRKRLWSSKGLNFSSVTVPSALDVVNYGGWDDPRLGGGSDQSGESNQFRNFLVSVGIDDRKYLFVFLLGLVCALAISRVRVSSILVFPASVFVFAVGFSFGLVRGGSASEVSLSSNKRNSKDENFRLSIEKLRNLVDFFDGFDVKVNNLRHDIRRAIDCNQITVSDLESYVKVIESISLSASHSRNVIGVCIDEMGLVNQEMDRISDHKPSRRRKDVSETGFDLFQLVGGLFADHLVGSKSSKLKDAATQEGVEAEVSDQSQGNAVGKRIFNSVNDNKLAMDQDGVEKLGDGTRRVKIIPDDGKMNLEGTGRGAKRLLNHEEYSYQDGVEKLGDGTRRLKVIPDDGKMNLEGMVGSAKRLLKHDEYSYRSRRLQFMNDRQVSLKMGHHDEIETWASHESQLDSVDFSFSLKHKETKAPFGQENMLKNSNGAYMHTDSSKKSEDGSYRSHFREENLNQIDDSHLDGHQVAQESEIGSSSSRVSDDALFDRYLSEANGLLKQARESVRGRDHEGHAEIRLYKSAKLLSQAIAMKPMSLVAVGLLGNTYLLHGELKLKNSRELRTLLSRNDPLLINKWGKALKGLDDRFSSKDKIGSVLVDVCEECEELLVEAGRKYRMALSLDGNDMRALYNWGLALSFRAQLIADIGPVSN